MTYNPKFKKKVYTHRRVAELKAMPKPEMAETYADVPQSPEPSKTNSKQKHADLALRWLNGYTETRDDGLLDRLYPEGEHERECAGAMANVLRSGDYSPDLIWIIADLIEDARIVRAYPKGGQAMPENDSKIAFFVRDQIKEGLSEQDALEMAAEHFSKSLKRIGDVWRKRRLSFRD